MTRLEIMGIRDRNSSRLFGDGASRMSESKRNVSSILGTVFAPAGLETQLPHGAGHVLPRRALRLVAEHAVRLADGRTQRRNPVQPTVQEELPSPDLVRFEKRDEALAAALEVAQDATREVPVEKLDAPSDRPDLTHAREVAVERLQVHLGQPGVGGGPTLEAPLLGSQVLRYGNLGNVHGLGVQPQVLPGADARPGRDPQPGRLGHGLRSARQEAAERRVQEPRVALLLRLVLELADQLRLGQQASGLGQQATQQRVGGVAMFVEVRTQRIRHAVSPASTRIFPKKS